MALNFNGILSSVMATEGKTYEDNKPSGDGTNGETSDPLLNILRLAADTITKDYNPEANFRTGDIVYDEAHKEHGILLGEKPAPVDSDGVEEILNQAVYNFSSRSLKNLTTYLVLTFYQSEQVDKKTGICKRFDWRIRYVNSRNLTKIEDIRKRRKDNSDNDLKFFCENQCIQECSKECALWKYRKL